MLKRRLLVFLQIETEPAGGKAAVAVRLFARDQRRQLERLGDRHPADLSRSHLGEHEVAALERPPKDRPRVALRGRRRSSPGAETAPSILVPLALLHLLSLTFELLSCALDDLPASLLHDLAPLAPETIESRCWIARPR